VHARGGDLQISWSGVVDELTQPVIMTGPVATVFEGVVEV